MPTDNPKIAAYVPQELKDRLVQFKDERDISESQAVTIILSEYFGMTQIVKNTGSTQIGGVTVNRVEWIERELITLREEQSELRTRLQDEQVKLREFIEAKFASWRIDSKESVVEPPTPSQTKTNEVIEQGGFVLSGQPELSPLSGTKLAARLGIGRKKLERRREDQDLVDWTRKLDPAKSVGWRFNSSDMKYYPVS